MRNVFTKILGGISLIVGLLWTNPAMAMTVQALNLTSASTASAKATSGQLIGYSVSDASLTPLFLDLFNTANPTLGTTAPTLEFPIASSGSVQTFPAWVTLGGSVIQAAVVTTPGGSATASAHVYLTIN